MDEVELFFQACFEDRLEDVASRLRETPGLVHARRIGERTPLHQAAFGGGERVASFLIDKGADVNATTEYGWVPLHYAAAPPTAAVAELLIRRGAKPNVANDDGGTPLHFAVDFGKLPMVELLLLHGAEPNAKNNEGQTPLDYAESDSEIAHALQAKGAVAGKAAASEKSEAKMPDWLQGHEKAIDQLLDKVEEQWNVPEHRRAGGDQGESP